MVITCSSLGSLGSPPADLDILAPPLYSGDPAPGGPGVTPAPCGPTGSRLVYSRALASLTILGNGDSGRGPGQYSSLTLLVSRKLSAVHLKCHNSGQKNLR